MGHPLADDVTFAVALAAWWQLRRSAYLLPHLRRGPSAFRSCPGFASKRYQSRSPARPSVPAMVAGSVTF